MGVTIKELAGNLSWSYTFGSHQHTDGTQSQEIKWDHFGESYDRKDEKSKDQVLGLEIVKNPWEKERSAKEAKMWSESVRIVGLWVTFFFFFIFFSV